MKPIVRISLVTLLIISVGFKAFSAFQHPIVLDRARVTDDLEKFIEGQGYIVASRQAGTEYDLILAIGPTCPIMLSVVPSNGFTEAALRLARPSDASQIVYVLDGRTYDSHPLIRSVILQYMDSIRNRIFGRHVIHPTLAYIAESECEFQDIQWALFSEIDLRSETPLL